jgi:hypothetical protein
MEGRSVGHNFERDPPKDHPCQVWFNLVQGENQYPLVFLLYTLFSVPDEGDSRNALLAHLAKGNVSFCHHLASVSVRPS